MRSMRVIESRGCAMVLGLYGILYLDVARRPAHGWLVAAVALTGKILGPVGLAWLILTGT